MITETGFSKDPTIMPEGIVVTFGKEMMIEQGGPLQFLRCFENCINDENNYWQHKCKNPPTIDVPYVYIICLNRLYGRCQFGGYEKSCGAGYKADGRYENLGWSGIILTGPFIKPNFKRILKGFQGFRYATKLF